MNSYRRLPPKLRFVDALVTAAIIGSLAGYIAVAVYWLLLCFHWITP